MDSDSSVSPLLSLACRFLPHDQWFTTHVDPEWKVKQVKSWLLAKCLSYAAPPSPPLRQSARKPLRPPSPITFAPDPRHRPISPITFAMPKAKATTDDIQPEEILPPVLPKKRAILPTASTSAKGDLYSQFTLIRFSTGQLLEDKLPLSFYDIQADELLELHRVGVVVTLPRAHPTRYLDAYWEGWVRVLRMRPIDAEEDSYSLYKIRQLETRALEWRDRWLVVREGNIHLCQNEYHTIHTLALSHLLQLTNSGLPPAATPSSKTRVLLAHFSPGQQKPSSLGSTRASSPIGMGRFDYNSDSDSNLSAPVFAHDSSDSNRPRRKLQKRTRKRPDPEFLAMDLKDDAAYISLLRVLHRHTLPRSTFVDKLPVGTADLLPHSYPHSSPFAHHPPPDDDADDPAPPALRHPPSLAHLRAPPRGLSLGALPYPEWRTVLLQRARRAGLGRIGRAVEWALWNGSAEEEGGWMLEGQSPVCSRRGKGKGKSGAQRERGRGRRPPKPTSIDGYDSDDPDPDDGGAASDGSSSSSGSGCGGGGARSETEWEGWMGDLQRQRRVAADEHIRVSMRLEEQRRAEESRAAELGLPLLLPGANASSSVVEMTVPRVGTGIDDRQRRAALEPSAVVTSLSGVNPPTHPSYHYQLQSQSHQGHGASPSAGSSRSDGAHTMTPVLSSPPSNESLGFAFSPLAELGDEDAAEHVAYVAHTRAHSHTLLHSVSMHDVHPHGYAHGYAHPLHMNFPASHDGAGPLAYDAAAFARRPSMPVIGSAARWGEGSRPSTAEHDAGGSSTGVTEVPRAGASASLGRSGSVGGTGLLRKRDGQREREREQQSDASDWRKGKERERERSPIPTFTARRPRLSVSTTDPPRPSRGQQQQQPQQALSPPATPLTPLTEHAHPPAPDTLNPLVPVKKKRRSLARGVSIRAEKFVKSLDSALDFVDGEEGTSPVVHPGGDCGTCAIIAELNKIFRNKADYDRFLKCREDSARRLLDVLQTLLDHENHLTSDTRRRFIIALRRLSFSSKLYPRCFILSDIQLGTQFNGGSFSDVYDGLLEGQIVVIKKMREFWGGALDLVEMFSREAAIWRQLSHPNVLPFFGLCTIDGKLCLVSPLMENKQLDHYLNKEQCSFNQRLSFILDVAMGLRYLHQHQIAHGDLKQSNILVTPVCTACIADFGIASVVNKLSSVQFTSPSQRGRGGTARYQAPEIHDGGSNSLESDIYAFACVAYEILTGTPVFQELRYDTQVMKYVGEGNRPRRPALENIDGVWELLENCWKQQPQERLTAVKVVEKLIGPTIGASTIQPHPWIETCTPRLRCSRGEVTLPTVGEIRNLIVQTEIV